MKIRLFLFFCLFNFSLYCQDGSILTFNEYLEIVKDYHPVMYQAKLLDNTASSTMKIARGGFDPKIEADWNHKSFDDKNYYSITSGALVIPTWYGIKAKAGYDRNAGIFLNQSDNIPTRGLWNAGISVPLGKGLLIDERRAELKKARIYQQVTVQEQNVIINKLLFEASVNYLEWQISKLYVSIAEEGQEIARLRLEGTVSSFLNGDKPAIDTLESFISYQSRQLDYQKAIQRLENSKVAINNFLWLDGETPLELDINTTPDEINLDLYKIQCDSLILIQDQLLTAHPELLLYNYNLANIDVDRRLAKEEFKPDLRLNYNPLIGVADDALFDQFNVNNYKIGASFSFPIIQRKERGKFELINLKKQEIEYKRNLKNQEIENKLKIYANNINQSLNQLSLLDETILNYSSLLNAENRKLSIGESSIFLVNSRENKYLESNYKRVEAMRKLLFSRFTYLFIGIRMREVN
jgi:outer membrane protein TolC